MGEPFAQRQALLRARHTAGPLPVNDWQDVITAFTTNQFTDAQMAAWLMARVLHGISDTEAVALTDAMLTSGTVLTHPGASRPVVDKHSTGGVADSTTLIVAPLAASVGLNMAKLSGKSLGHTGGTLDKLASIPHLRTDLATDAFCQQVEQLGVAVAAATHELAPADRRLYALRDHIELVDDTALIAASIMSKKLATGARHLVLDVKLGQASILHDDAQTRQLAHQCIAIGRAKGQTVTVVLSDMNQPLGPSIGNALEVRAAVDVLTGHTFGRLGELSVLLVTELLRQTGVSANDADAMVRDALTSGAALSRFVAFVAAQGGDTAVATDPTGVLRINEPTVVWRAKTDGYVAAVDTTQLGVLARELAGSENDLTAGIDGEVSIGMLSKDLSLGIHTADAARAARALDVLDDAIVVTDNPVTPPKLITEIIR